MVREGLAQVTTSLRLNSISAGYGSHQILNRFSLDVLGGEIAAILGPSGCGKTTILKVVAGLLAPFEGDLFFNDERVNDLPAEKRGAVMVFQKPLLFPHLTVFENVAFGLKMRKVPKHEITKRVSEALGLVHLEGYERRIPKELSGGQEQRVSLARALVTQPRLLLLDEPFSALDENLRAEMRALVRGIQRQLKITTIFVTHDQAEAALISDRIAFLLDGKLEQFSAPRDFFTAPRTLQTALFFGWKAISGSRSGCAVDTALGRFAFPETFIQDPGGGSVTIAFRPDSARMTKNNNGSVERNILRNILLTGTIESIADLGIRLRYSVAFESGDLIEIEHVVSENRIDEDMLKAGDSVFIHIPSEAIRIF